MFPLSQIFPDPTHFPTHPTLYSLFGSLPLAYTLFLNKLKTTNKKLIKEKKGLPTINHANTESILVLANYCWTRNLPWNRVDTLSESPLDKTDFFFHRKY